ncbi:MAG TPA: VOC family protein [Bryobacteraceae bacterium]|nr:VOC family protein [Bryobacteraceae bacterium]
MFQGVDHTAISSPEPRRLADWYISQLEFRLHSENEGKYFLQGANGTLIEIIPGEGERGPRGMAVPGFRHLAIGVDDFEAAREHLRKTGIEFLTDVIYVGKLQLRLIFFSDPEGNILHLIKRENSH